MTIVAPSVAPSELTLEKRKSLAEQIADKLVEAVGSGALKPGERVVEADIAARFRVSRVPVREALKILATQGIFEGEAHRGLHVLNLDDELVDCIRNARLAVETLAISALISSAERLQELGPTLDSRIAQMSIALQRKDLTAVNRADLGFHSDLCLLSGNKIVWMLWQALSRHIWIVFGREVLSDTALANIVQQHEELKLAILSGDEARATGALHPHIFFPLAEFQMNAP